ncbi:hypothetical protein [Streptomyces sp. NPDC051211]|uniref:hypothetical protein n=1 Tax=Streptomyces sp. NPDC051211 TaxID=3154643 RepID=UPI0034501E7D
MSTMSLQPAHLLQLLRKLVADDPSQRALGADESTDWPNSYAPVDGRILAGVLAICAACESDPTALEAQLNAIIQLGGLADEESVSYLKVLEGADLPDGLADYVHDILHE